MIVSDEFIHFLNSLEFNDIYHAIESSIDCTRTQPPIRPICKDGSLAELPRYIDIVPYLGMYHRQDNGNEKYRLISRYDGRSIYIDRNMYSFYENRENVFPELNRVFGIEYWVKSYNLFISLVILLMWTQTKQYLSSQERAALDEISK